MASHRCPGAGEDQTPPGPGWAQPVLPPPAAGCCPQRVLVQPTSPLAACPPSGRPSPRASASLFTKGKCYHPPVPAPAMAGCQGRAKESAFERNWGKDRALSTAGPGWLQVTPRVGRGVFSPGPVPEKWGHEAVERRGGSDVTIQPSQMCPLGRMDQSKLRKRGCRVSCRLDSLWNPEEAPAGSRPEPLFVPQVGGLRPTRAARPRVLICEVGTRTLVWVDRRRRLGGQGKGWAAWVSIVPLQIQLPAGVRCPAPSLVGFVLLCGFHEGWFPCRSSGSGMQTQEEP